MVLWLCGSGVKVQQLKLEPVDLGVKVQNMMKLGSKHDEIGIMEQCGSVVLWFKGQSSTTEIRT